jgi:hypothetical protein
MVRSSRAHGRIMVKEREGGVKGGNKAGEQAGGGLKGGSGQSALEIIRERNEVEAERWGGGGVWKVTKA